MKRILTITATFFILFWGVYSCNSDKSQKEVENENVEKTIADSNALNNKTNADFDLLGFKQLADSFIANIENKSIAFHLIQDTLKTSELSEQELKRLPTGYLVRNSTYCIKYRFDLDSPDKDLGVSIIQSQFNSIIETDSVFDRLRYLANEDKVTEGGLTGLTYTNDYVLKQPLKIYWLNTGCKYSFDNHKKYGAFLVKSLKDKTIIDSLWCECGAVDCKKKK